MFFITPYVVIDITDSSKNWEVVCEEKSHRACADYLRAERSRECVVVKEAGEETYRGICPVNSVISGQPANINR